MNTLRYEFLVDPKSPPFFTCYCLREASNFRQALKEHGLSFVEAQTCLATRSQTIINH